MQIMFWGRPFCFLTEERQWYKLVDYLYIFLLDDRPAQAGMLLLILSVVFPAVPAILPQKQKEKKRISLFLYLAALFLLFVAARPAGSHGVRPFSLAWYLTQEGFHESRVLISLINLIFFIPAGAMLRAEEKVRGIRRKTAAVLLISIVIECSQFLLHRGFFAIQDILAYLTGAWLGMLLSALREQFRKRREKKYVHSN